MNNQTHTQKEALLVFNKIIGSFVDIVGFGGAIAMVYGVYQINNNYGIIFGGFMAMAFSYLVARR